MARMTFRKIRRQAALMWGVMLVGSSHKTANYNTDKLIATNPCPFCECPMVGTRYRRRLRPSMLGLGSPLSFLPSTRRLSFTLTLYYPPRPYLSGVRNSRAA
ncbi:hypothetical protein BDY19DRAFT_121256 [Irpex rosettiformis]|uniref:Uncharacterized protein n=1 Tax=Irpex rosettiformis TaxID=378272 RepID=A0ACB8TM25_9APHY|nr:hypothetical protein BDY19DRAFT_121256 [Irpex rosettiformis]